MLGLVILKGLEITVALVIGGGLFAIACALVLSSKISQDEERHRGGSL